MAWIHANLISKRRIQHLCSRVALFPPPFFVLYRITSLHSTSLKTFYNFCLMQDRRRRVLQSSFYCFIFTYIQLCLEQHYLNSVGLLLCKTFSIVNTYYTIHSWLNLWMCRYGGGAGCWTWISTDFGGSWIPTDTSSGSPTTSAPWPWETTVVTFFLRVGSTYSPALSL